MKKIILISIIGVLILFLVSRLIITVEKNIGGKARVGCRAPDEPGCSQCLEKNEYGCSRRYWTGGASTNIAPWYNAGELISCRSNIPICAICTKRDDSDFQWWSSKKKLSQCNCVFTIIGNDPCFAADSCACICRSYKGYKNLCPLEQK